jgi:dTDP-4-dehydrorhamnose 3,5-epimerase
MQVTDLGLGGVVEVIPWKHGDSRGFFAETYQRQRFAAAGLDRDWVQDNQSHSVDRGVLRGLHLQVAPFAQDKLVRVLHGSIFDVAVDVRPGSATYGKWVSRILSAERFNQLLVPKGFAHGFLTLQPHTSVFYKVSAGYAPDCERSILWSDPDLAIAWPLDPGQRPLLSPRDAAAPRLAKFASTIVF